MFQRALCTIAPYNTLFETNVFCSLTLENTAGVTGRRSWQRVKEEKGRYSVNNGNVRRRCPFVARATTTTRQGLWWTTQRQLDHFLSYTTVAMGKAGVSECEQAVEHVKRLVSGVMVRAFATNRRSGNYSTIPVVVLGSVAPEALARSAETFRRLSLR